MCDLSGSEIEPASSALAGEFFTIEPPGKPMRFLFKVSNITSVRELIQKNKVAMLTIVSAIMMVF